MELRHLRAFVAVAEEQSFTKASARLHVAQPALSVQVRRLEDQLGVTLIDRSRRTIGLTPAGDVLLEGARRLLYALEQTVDLVRRTGTGAIGRLSVGFVPSASNSTMPTILRRFSTSYPNVALDLRELDRSALVRGLRERHLDVAFMYLPFEDDAYEHYVVTREHWVVALPEDHRLAGRARVDAADLAEEPFILPPQYEERGLSAQILEICQEGGFQPRAAHENVWLVQTTVGLVAAGAGVALVPASTQALGREGVVYRPLAKQQRYVIELGAVWRRDDSSPVLSTLIDTLADKGPHLEHSA
jgi:DNA-binding transcriptional LysR family regulator